MADKKPEPQLANPAGVRSFSDQLDKVMGWEGAYKEDSRLRGLIHAGWHYGAGVKTGNEREYERAKEQFSRTTRAPSPPLKK